LFHGSAQSGVTKLLVHIVRARSRVVAQPDGKVLDDIGALFVNLVHRENLASSPLHLLVLVENVPEAGPRSDLIRSKNLHAVELRVGVRFCGLLSANDDVVVDGLMGIHVAS